MNLEINLHTYLTQIQKNAKQAIKYQWNFYSYEYKEKITNTFFETEKKPFHRILDRILKDSSNVMFCLLLLFMA